MYYNILYTINISITYLMCKPKNPRTRDQSGHPRDVDATFGDRGNQELPGRSCRRFLEFAGFVRFCQGAV